MSIAEILNELDGQGNLEEQQAFLESISQGLGIDQYRKTAEKAKQGNREATTRYGSQLVAHAVDKVAEGIEQFIALTEQGGAGRKHLAGRYLKKVDPKISAYLALRCVIDGISGRQTVQKVALEIASMIEDEVRFRMFEEAEKTAFKYTKEKVKKATTYRHKKNVMSVKMAHSGVDFAAWPKTDKLHIGVKLLDIVIETTGYVELGEINKSISGKPKTVKIVQATKETEEWIGRKNTRSELLAPKYLPCVIPPKDWTSPTSGGYHSKSVRPLTFIKTSYRNYIEEVSNMVDDMPRVYEAVNALQRTPWAVNKKVLSVMQEAWDGQMEMPCLVTRRDTKEIPCSRCGALVALSQRNSRNIHVRHECFETDEVALRRWKVLAAKTHEANARLISKRIQVNQVIWIAGIMSRYSKIYMPYQLDFRGRIYAAPFYLNPQGADYAKGLLTFGETMPINDALAAGWLAIHGANVYGNDKVSLADRIAFIGSMHKEIRAIAESPLDHTELWVNADKPWQFLAFCFEWAGFLEHGYGYESSLPIALDGSCSGIQHFSAMLRDPQGAEAVNLMPSNEPRDIYQMVCNRVLERFKADTENPYAAGWLSLNPDRKMTKRQVMTLPYGSTQFSCKEYTNEYLQEILEERRYSDPSFVMPWPENERYKAVSYASEIIWEAIGEVVIGARQVMDWLRAWSKETAKAGLPITWTTPVGFPVYQAYPSMKHRRVATQLGEGIMRLTLKEAQPVIDKKRMENAIAPNFVHSMDACHLVMSVSYAKNHGIKDFAMIHDSFGTHAANTERFSELIRESFVDLYTNWDILANFKGSMVSILPPDAQDNIPKDLQKGDLNLECVKGSSFFFA